MAARENIEKCSSFLSQLFAGCEGAIRLRLKPSPIITPYSNTLDIEIGHSLYAKLFNTLANKNVWGTSLSFLPCTYVGNRPVDAPAIFQKTGAGKTASVHLGKPEWVLLDQDKPWFIARCEHPMRPNTSSQWADTMLLCNPWIEKPALFPIPLPWSTDWRDPDLSPFICVPHGEYQPAARKQDKAGPQKESASGKMKEAFHDAKALDLVELFSKHVELKKLSNQSKRMVSSECPFCGSGTKLSTRFQIDTEDNLFFCFACGVGGSPIEYAMWNYDCDKNKAALILTGQDDEFEPQTKKTVIIKPREEKDRDEAELQSGVSRVLTALFDASRKLPSSAFQSSLDYLSIVRGIPLDVLREAWERRLLSFLPDDPFKANELFFKVAGRQTLIDTGFLKSDKKMVGLSFNPILFPYGSESGAISSMEFRKNVLDPGEYPKSIRRGIAELPWVWHGESNSPSAMTEGVPDALSLVALLDWQGSIIAIPGVQNWREHWIGCLDGDQTTVLLFDNDENKAGENAAEKLGLILSAAGMPYEAWIPQHVSQDINKMLMEESKHLPNQET